MSSAKARLRVSSTIALPPYLITTTWPWNSLQPRQRVGEDLGEHRVARGVVGPHRAGRPPPRGTGRGGPRVAGHVEYALFSWTYACVRSLVHTVAVASPLLRSIRTCTSRPVRSTPGGVLARDRRPADLDAVERDVEVERVERGGGGADGGQDPAPVRVAAEHGALEQVAARDRAADLDGVGLRGGADHLDRDVVLGPLGVAHELLGEVVADGGHRGGERLRRRRGAGRPAGQQDDGVVGGHAAVGVEPVEGDAAWPRAARRRRSAASTSASVVRTTSIVASAGASMPAPLAMPPTTNPSPCATACFGTVSVVMIASAATAPPSPESGGVRGAHAVEQLLRRAAAGRSARWSRPRRRRRPGADQVGDQLGGAVGGREAVRAGVAVGAAGVEHDGARAAVGRGLLAPQHGVRLAPVGRVDGRGDVARAGADDERDVGPAARLEAGGDGRGGEPGGRSTTLASLRPPRGRRRSSRRPRRRSAGRARGSSRCRRWRR